MRAKPVVTLSEFTKQINVLQKRQAKAAKREKGMPPMFVIPYQEWLVRAYFEKGASPEDALADLARAISEENDAMVYAETAED